MRFNWAMSLMPYGHEWRQQRRVFDQYLGHNVIQQYYPIMYEERLTLLRQLKVEPDQFMDHLLLYVHSYFSRLVRMTHPLSSL
jgi:cytochrome P450